MENRVRELEGLFSELFPDSDIDTMLSKARSTRSGSNDILSSQEEARESEFESRGNQYVRAIQERLPTTPNGFEWSEMNVSKKMGNDGMAVLAVNPHGVGYLGKSQWAAPSPCVRPAFAHRLSSFQC